MSTGQSIQAQRGRDFLLKVSPAGSPPNYVTVGGQRATDVSFNGNPVDISNKGSGGWRELMPDGGLRDMAVTASGIFDKSSVAYAAIETAARNQTLLECQMIDARGDAWSGWWAVNTFKRSGSHTDSEMFDIALASSGPITFTAGT